MRVSGADYAIIMRDAVAEQMRLAPDPGSVMLLNGLNELVRRGDGRVSIESMREALRDLIPEVSTQMPETAKAQSEEIAALLSESEAAVDPAVYFKRALRLFDEFTVKLGAPGQLPASKFSLIKRLADWEASVIIGDRSISTSPHDILTVPFSADTLTPILRGSLPDAEDIKIERFDELIGGMSKRTFSVTTDTALRGREEMIIKKAEGVPASNLDCMLIEREFRVLKVVFDAGLLVPEPLVFGTSNACGLTDFYAMRRMPGICNTNMLSNDSPIPREVMLDIARQMARLHSIPLDTIADFASEFDPDMLTLRTDQAVHRRQDAWREFWLRQDRLPSPVENYLLSWLAANKPLNPLTPSLVHGDMTPHNCLWEGNRLTAVLDWECAHFGDPAEDLAYAKPFIERRMDWAEFVYCYEQNGGPSVDTKALHYYNCALNVRSVLMANLYLTNPQPVGIRALLVDTKFAGMFIDICLNAVNDFETMPTV